MSLATGMLLKTYAYADMANERIFDCVVQVSNSRYAEPLGKDAKSAKFLSELGALGERCFATFVTPVSREDDR
jgi:hypothetical protein